MTCGSSYGLALHASLLFDEFAGHPLAVTREVVASDVVGPDFSAERLRPLELDPRGGLGHNDDHASPVAHAGEGDAGGEVPGRMCHDRPRRISSAW